MKILKAYTLMEVLVVMSIMTILLGTGMYAYTSFSETTKYNQDIANIQNDIMVIQRASMLLDKDPDENWLYGVGIDFGGVINGYGTYTFFKWCSEFNDFGDVKTKSEYPNYDPDDISNENGDIPTGSYVSNACNNVGTESILAPLDGYGAGNLNLDEEVSIIGDVKPRFLLFESVSGRAFVYDEEGNRIDDNIQILFNKNSGDQNILVIKNLTGRTELSKIEE